MSMELLHVDFTNGALGDAIKELDHTDGITVKTLAEFADLSPSMIYQIISGEKRMMAGNFVRLAKRLAELGNTRLIDALLLPPTLKVQEVDHTSARTNGCIDDETADMVVAMSHVKQAFSSRNRRAFDTGMEELERVKQRMEQEGRAI